MHAIARTLCLRTVTCVCTQVDGDLVAYACACMLQGRSVAVIDRRAGPLHAFTLKLGTSAARVCTHFYGFLVAHARGMHVVGPIDGSDLKGRALLQGAASSAAGPGSAASIAATGRLRAL